MKKLLFLMLSLTLIACSTKEFTLEQCAAFSNKKDHDQAIACFNKIIDREPDNGKAYIARGNTFFDLGEYGRAIVDFDLAIEIDPANSKAYNYRGNAFFELGDRKRAIEDFKEVVKLKPKDEAAQQRLDNLLKAHRS